VIGLGGAGSAALCHLARRGGRVVGVDRFPPGHDRGSSHGATRMIRLAYFEHPDYVPLLRRSFDLWAELEAAHGAALYRETGVIEVGPPDGVLIPGILRAAREHDLRVEPLESFAGLRWPDSMQALFEARAGLLNVEECVRAHVADAARHGAELRIGEAVRAWRADGAGVIVETDRGELRGDRLVITPGAWAPELLFQLGVPFRVLRKSLFWYEGAPAPAMPAFYFELPEGHFYGFPPVDARGFKFAEHTGGIPIDDPLHPDRTPLPEEQARVEAFLSAHLPDVSRRCTQHAVCFYTVTPDEHFIVDRHPEHDQVVFAAGLSGHGFKFAPVLGEALADLALDGGTRLPIGFLRLGRFG